MSPKYAVDRHVIYNALPLSDKTPLTAAADVPADSAVAVKPILELLAVLVTTGPPAVIPPAVWMLVALVPPTETLPAATSTSVAPGVPIVPPATRSRSEARRAVAPNAPDADDATSPLAVIVVAVNA